MQKLAWNSHDVLVFEWIFFLLQAKKVFLCHILWWWIFFCFWSLHDRTVSKFDDLVSFRPPCYQQHTIVFSENKFVSFCREHWNSTLLITLTHMLLKRLVQVWSPVQFFTVCKWLVCEFSVLISSKEVVVDVDLALHSLQCRRILASEAASLIKRAIIAQGAHTSSVSVYVRNMKKCMGES